MIFTFIALGAAQEFLRAPRKCLSPPCATAHRSVPQRVLQRTAQRHSARETFSIHFMSSCFETTPSILLFFLDSQRFPLNAIDFDQLQLIAIDH